MKKTLRNLAVAATLLVGATATTHAADLVQKNAYAYDIRVDGTDQRAPIVTYKLNGLASAVSIKAYADGQLVATQAGTVNQSNKVTLDIPDAAYGDITFTVDVTTKTTVSTPTQIKEGTPQTAGAATYGYRFNVPMGVAVNNSTESNTFGQIIVSEFSAPSGSAYFTSTAAGGRGNALYAFDPQMQPIKNTQANGAYGFSGGLNMSTKGEFARVRFSDDGRLFMYSFDAKEGCGIYEFVNTGTNASDANSLNSAATQVLTVAKPAAGDVATNCNTTFDVVGSGENVKIGLLKLNTTSATYGVVGGVYFYNLGTKKTWSGNPSQTIAQGTQYLNTIIRTSYINCGWDADGKGFNIIHRVSSPKTSDEALMHYNLTGSSPVCNWESATNAPAYFTNVNAAAYNADRTLLATASTAGVYTVYSVSVKDGGTPVYKQITSITAYTKPSTGTLDNITDLAFDYANNLYAVDRTGEYFAAWQLPHQSNGVVTVPAPSSQSYHIEKVELPKLYVVGAFQGWNPENPVELEQDLQGEYEFTFPNKADEGFKLSFAKGDWAAFNAAVIGYGVDGCTILGGHSQQLYAADATSKNDGNLFAPCPGTWSIKVNEDNLLTLNGRPDVLQDMIYVRGDITDWGAENTYSLSLIDKDKQNPVMTANGEYEFKAEFVDFYGDFKIADDSSDWSGLKFGVKGGATNITNGKTMEATSDGGNFELDNKIYTNVTVSFYFNPVDGKSSWLNFSGTERNHYAYGLQLTPPTDLNGSYVFTFQSTGNVNNAYIHFKDPNYQPATEVNTLAFGPVEQTDPGVQTWEIGEVTKGENSVAIPSTWFARTTHIWSVELEKSVKGDIITSAMNVGGGRAAVACFTDPAYPEVYGYTVIGRSNNGGIDIYDPSGKQIASALFANNAAMGGVNPGMADSDATPSDATTRGNYVYLSSMSDAANGVVAFDIQKIINNEPTEPIVVYTGKNISTLGFWGKDADTRLILGDKTAGEFASGDTYGCLTYNVIGNNIVTDNKFTKIASVGSAQIINVRTYVAPTENGFFVSTHRGDPYGTAGMRYVTQPQGENLWNLISGDPNKQLANTTDGSGAVALSADGKKLAMARYTGIRVYNVTYDEGGKPILSVDKDYDYPFGRSTVGTAIKFDAAGNILAANSTNGYYRVFRADDASVPGDAFTVDDTVTGVEEVGVEAVGAEAVYYNLNGVRVEKGNLTPGVYVKVVGKTSTKVVIK